MPTSFRKIVIALALAAASCAVAQQGKWTKLATPCPEDAETALLLTDGTVLVKSYDNFQHYFKLTPTSDFRYDIGKWSKLADSINGVLYGPTEVLRDGRVFIAGGEYLSNISDHNTCQVYDPVANKWTAGPDGLYGDIGDSGSSILPDGRIICSTRSGPQTQIFDPTTMTWSATGSALQDSGDEESWQLLPDGSVLNLFFSGQRYIPSLGTWQYTAPLPGLYVDSVYEIGPLLYLYNGQAIIFGGCNGTGATGLYTPPSTLLGTDDSWSAGPVIPNGNGCPDTPACVEVNGKVLFIATDTDADDNWGPPIFYEYDPSTGLISSIKPPPVPAGTPAYVFRMLALPNGQVMVTGFNQDVWLYTPTSGPADAWRATLSGYTANADGSFTLTGTQLNGLTNGAGYGDECQVYTNYPIVLLQSTSTGKYYYARSYNFSTMGLATGSTPVSAQFSVLGTVPPGQYNLTTAASGVRSINSLLIGFGIVMPSGQVNASPGGTVTYNMPVTDYFVPTRTVTTKLLKAPSWVTWDGTNLTASPPIGTLNGIYPVLLSATDNGTPPASATSSVYVQVAAPALKSNVFASTAVVDGGTVQLNITLTQPAGVGGVKVTLASTYSNLSVQPSVTIPNGASSASVTVTAATNPTSTQGRVTATYAGVSLPATIRILPSG